MLSRKISATLLAVTAAAALTACSDSNDSPSNAVSFNEADVTFAQDMIPHHRQATEMAALAPTRSVDVEILALAEKIEAAQAPEIETMTGWLKEWGEEVPPEMSGDMDHSSHANMPGMMSAEDMTALEGASGREFDEMFLTMMIEHHTGAIEMAKTEESDGTYDEAVELATTIQQEQADEIALMEQLLGR
jgi:uncharacterized protein (DUF305 family)